MPAMFELRAVPGFAEHADVEKGVSFAVLLSQNGDAAFCELSPSLVAAPELP